LISGHIFVGINICPLKNNSQIIAFLEMKNTIIYMAFLLFLVSLCCLFISQKSNLSISSLGFSKTSILLVVFNLIFLAIIVYKFKNNHADHVRYSIMLFVSSLSNLYFSLYVNDPFWAIIPVLASIVSLIASNKYNFLE
jgi:lysylphosphatidylglycerol synthetase-like protein (DUF2156 family)